MTCPIRHRRLVAALRKKYASGPGVAVVEVDGPVEDVAEGAIAKIEKAISAKAKTLVIAINSDGGYVDSAFDIIEAITRFKGRTIGMAAGSCDSAAALLLAACRDRVAAVDAKFLIHSTWVDRSGRREMTLASVEATRSQLKGYDKKVKTFMTARCGKAFAKLYSDSRDHLLSAREAERLGLLTAVEWEASLSDRRPPIDPKTLVVMQQRQRDLRAHVDRAAAKVMAGAGVHAFLRQHGGR